MFTASSTAASKPAAAPKIETPKSQPQSKPTSTSTTPPKTTPVAYHQDSFHAAPAGSTRTTPKTTGTGPVASTNQAGGTPPTIDDVVKALKDGKKDDATRTMIHDFFAPLSMAESKAAMDRIRTEGLVDNFIDAAARDDKGKAVDSKVKDALREVFNSGRLDVYAETISNTSITVGNFGSGKLQYDPGTNAVQLDTATLEAATKQFGPETARNVLAHELFHAFSNAHGGQGYTAIDEGFGIAAREYAFTDQKYNLAEMVYGTMKAYRDGGNSTYQFGDFSKADPKLRELMNAFASRDSSQLAWKNPTQLQAEYTKFFEPLTRDVNHWDKWLADVAKATADMLAARAANQVPRPGHPVPN